MPQGGERYRISCNAVRVSTLSLLSLNFETHCRGVDVDLLSPSRSVKKLLIYHPAVIVQWSCCGYYTWFYAGRTRRGYELGLVGDAIFHQSAYFLPGNVSLRRP